MSLPFLKWAGGKSRLIAPISTHLHPKGVLIEPFAGSASLSLALEYEAYRLNDINPDLINLYCQLKENGKGFIDYAASFFVPENNCQNQYLQFRETFNHQKDDKPLSAALFLYLNRHGFNGLCRYNKSGGFNVPFGKYAAPYFPKNEMAAFVAKAKRISLSCLPFEHILDNVETDDNVYCDPPYIPISPTSSFTTYYGGGFDIESHKRLAGYFQTLNVKSFVVSNSDTPLTRSLYQGASMKTVQVRRSIGANKDSRGKVGELIIYRD